MSVVFKCKYHIGDNIYPLDIAEVDGVEQKHLQDFSNSSLVNSVTFGESGSVTYHVTHADGTLGDIRLWNEKHDFGKHEVSTKRITADDVLLAIKKAGTSQPAKVIVQLLPYGTSTRAFATAARKLVETGQITTRYKKGICYYRFRRMKPLVHVRMKNFQAIRTPL